MRWLRLYKIQCWNQNLQLIFGVEDGIFWYIPYWRYVSKYYDYIIWPFYVESYQKVRISFQNIIFDYVKNGTFKPVRKYYGRSVAVLATFLVSGLLHEYVNIVLLSEVRDSIEWKNMIFFLWNGMIIYCEAKIGHWFIFQWMNRSLPSILITSLVILTALPLGHLFTGEYIAGGYFDHITVANPFIVKLEWQNCIALHWMNI